MLAMSSFIVCCFSLLLVSASGSVCLERLILDICCLYTVNLVLVVLLKAIRRNPVTKSASEAEMEEVISKCLHFAGDRSGGRQHLALRHHVHAQSN